MAKFDPSLYQSKLTPLEASLNSPGRQNRPDRSER